MRKGITNFEPNRLSQARESRGLTQVALGEIINRTTASISRWESGKQLPEIDALEDLSKAFNLPVSFFLRSIPDHGDSPMFFRSMAAMTRTVRERTKARLRWGQDISLKLQEDIDLPEVNLLSPDLGDYKEITNSQIEKIASECRKMWGLGIAPISDMLLVLENAGIVVIKEEVGVASMDGLSNWSSADNRPYIFIAKDKDSCVRSRIDAAHELGHLILHRNVDEKYLNAKQDFTEIERQAFYFAGAFLMPDESFSAEIRTPSINNLLALKERWKVSIGAMIMRCVSLKIIDEDYKEQMFKYCSSRGWRKNEPLDDVLLVENPRLLSRSIRLLVENGIKSRKQLLNDFRLNSVDIESLAGLPRGYMNDTQAEIFNFPKLKDI